MFFFSDILGYEKVTSTGTWLSLVSIDIKTKELAILEKFLLILVQIRANKS